MDSYQEKCDHEQYIFQENETMLVQGQNCLYGTRYLRYKCCRCDCVFYKKYSELTKKQIDVLDELRIMPILDKDK